MGNIREQKAKKFNQMWGLPREFPEALAEASSPTLFVVSSYQWELHFLDVRCARKGRIVPMIACVGREESGENEDRDVFGRKTLNLFGCSKKWC